jgi:hypothetical protein
MLLRSHPTAACPLCRRQDVWYGLKEEATGWKILCTCRSNRDCNHEWRAGRIPMNAVDSLDEVSERAKTIV